ncbi:glycosyltransferase [candidate division KSB1 bacterium]|nr:glycosyltransferase [candidate division KSB1 bacterium]
MPDFTIVLFFIYAMYLLLGLLILFGLKNPGQTEYSGQPFVSVIIAARNEEENLPNCLTSLIALDYPSDKLEIIVVDDHSSDSTARIISRFAETYPFIKPYPLEAGQNSTPGKAGALNYGIRKSKGEFIFVTDADCRVPSTWVKSLLSLFSDSVGVVGGVTLLDKRHDSSPLFGKIQSCDWLFLLSVAASANNYGLPLSWFGNNMAFRRKTYNDVGGFEKISNNLVEDIALLLEIHKSSQWGIKFSFSPHSLLHSIPAPNLKEYYNQRKRWASGIRIVHSFGILLLTVSVLAHILTVLVLLWSHSITALAGIILLSVTDFAVLNRASRLLGRTDLLRYVFIFEIYYFIYTILLPIFLLFDKKTSWKDRQYSLKKNKIV